MNETNNIFPRSPGKGIKPEVTVSEVKTCLSKLYGLKGGSLIQLQGYDDLNFYFGATISCNPFIKSLSPSGYIVKIMNSLDSSKNALCEAQNELMLFLRERDIPSPKPVQTMRGDYYTKEQFPKTIRTEVEPKQHIIRVFECLPGITLKKTPKSYPLFYNLGIFLAKLDQVLKEFSHTVYETHKSVWHLNSLPDIKSHTKIIQDSQRRELVDSIIENFIQDVQSKEDTIERGMIHGDFNENNILMTNTEEWEVSAILDFGDSHYSSYLFELAIAMCYMMFECKRQGLDPIVGTGHLLAGYLTVRPTFPVDYSLLRTCIFARICQSLVLGLVAFSIQPENEYVLDSQEAGWQILEEFHDVSEKEVTQIWDSVIQSYNVKRQSNSSSLS